MSVAFIQIATHDGNFHSDEIVAIAVLTTIFKNHKIIRSRDRNVLALVDIVVDVGDVYDHTLRRYDHHMRNPPRDERGHMYSSAGLIWKHYGDAYLTSIGIPKSISLNNTSFPIKDEVFKMIHNKWIYPIDLVDNGEIPGPTVITELVTNLRPIDPEKTRAKYDEQFFKALKLITDLLERTCFHCADTIISQSRFISGNNRIVNNGRILISDHPIISSHQITDPNIHFSIFPTKDYVDEDVIKYTIKPIPSRGKKNFKTSIPSILLGARSELIVEITGCEGISYIHHNGFRVISETEEAAVNFCNYLIDHLELN